MVPAVVALTLYLLITFLILPFVRRYRHRYNQYLPVSSGLSERTSSFRRHVQDALMNFFLPRSMRWDENDHRFGIDEASGDEDLFDDQDGEGLVGFDIDQRRREALERRRSDIGDQDRRLSRELEEGFRDDSDDEEDAVVRTLNARPAGTR
jgi:hypothetical protein